MAGRMAGRMADEPLPSAAAPLAPLPMCEEACARPLNWDDLDPISLEPVCSTWPYFEIGASGADNDAAAAAADAPGQSPGRGVRRYDAWAWLEMLVRCETGEYRHPTTGEPLGAKDRAACVRACREAAAKTAAEAAKAQAAGQDLGAAPWFVQFDCRVFGRVMLGGVFF
jgi:hypothetical protein